MARRGVAGIFGENEVDVDLDPGALAWRVSAADGRLLMQVPWRWAYDQTDLGKRVYHRNNFLTRDDYLAHNSRWEAFEVCMCAYPLTRDERDLLEARFPGITSRRQYVVADPIWQPEPRDRGRSDTSTPTRPARNRTPRAIEASSPVVSLPPEPPATVETAHEAGERKLLL